MFPSEPWSQDGERSEIEAESYPGHLEVQIPLLVASAKWRDPKALTALAQLAGDKDPRTRQRVLECQLQAGAGDRQALLEGGLKDSDPRVREAALLDICRSAPSECEQLVPLIACCLTEKLERLRSLASEALQRIGTTNDELLASIHRFLSATSFTPPATSTGSPGGSRMRASQPSMAQLPCCRYARPPWKLYSILTGL